MKSKTSCFNRTLYKKNVTHYWPLWVAYLSYLLLAVPLRIWEIATNEWYYQNYNETDRMYEIMERAVEMMIEPTMIFLFAVAMALAVFSYLYVTKSANMMHALPVNRLELYVTNYLSGLSFLVIPQMIVFFVSVLVCLANQITCIQYLFIGLMMQIGMAFFAYSLAVFVAMFTGQLLAMPVYYFVVNYLYAGCMYIVSSVMELLSYGLTNQWNPGKSCVLSPLYYLNNNVWVCQTYNDKTEVVTGLEINGASLVAGYALVAVVITIVAYRLYRRRQIETAGDWISIGIVKPVFRWGVAMCGGVLLSIAFTGMLKESHQVNMYVCVISCMVVTGFICFFAAEMLLHKNFKVFHKKRFVEWLGFTAVAVLFFTLFEVDAFGVERALPQADEIEVAFVNMDYPIAVETEDISQLLAVHQDVISHKKEYREVEQQMHGFYYTTFRYYLKDGSVFERRYPIPVSEAYIEDKTSPAARILAWESETENLKHQILGVNYDTNRYFSGYVDLYNEEDDYRNYMFNEEELDEIIKAIEKDIEAGNYTNYYLYSIAGEESDKYFNNIGLDYYSESDYYDNWDYYSCYAEYKNGTMRTQERATGLRQGSCYIEFGPECVYTVNALEKLKIVDDTWKLYKQEEYFD